MSFIRRLFSKSKPDDFETVLSDLQRDIQKRQAQLSDLRLRERRTTLLVTLYTVAFWGIYVAARYLGVGSGGKWYIDVPVIVGPVIILFVRRIVQIWYKRKGDAEEKTLQSLRKTQRAKIDEFKKKTNYNATRSLIERYDESQAPPSPMRPQMQSPQVPMTPVRGGPRPSVGIPNRGPIPVQPPPGSIQNGPGPSPLPPHLAATLTPQPYTPARKQWYDKLADALLGDDEGTAGDAATRYALICQQCFKHNGLVKESMWEDAQYVCPKCGHFNQSERAKREQRRRNPSLSPSAASRGSTSSPEASPSSSRGPTNPSIVVSGEDEDAGLSPVSIDGKKGHEGRTAMRARKARRSTPSEDADTSMMEVDDSP